MAEKATQNAFSPVSPLSNSNSNAENSQPLFCASCAGLIHWTVAGAADAFPVRPSAGHLKPLPRWPEDGPRIGIGMGLPPFGGSGGPGMLISPCKAFLPQRWLNCALLWSDGESRIDTFQSPHCLRGGGAVNCVQIALTGGDKMHGSLTLPRCARRRAGTASKR
jgi:hypothetical protein